MSGLSLVFSVRLNVHIQLLRDTLSVGLADDVVAVKHSPRAVAADDHGPILMYTGADEVPDASAERSAEGKSVQMRLQTSLPQRIHAAGILESGRDELDDGDLAGV